MTAPESSPKPAAAAIAEIRQRYADSSKHLVNWWDSDIKVLLLEIQRLEAAAIQRGDGQSGLPVVAGVQASTPAHSLDQNFMLVHGTPPAAKPSETSGATPNTVCPRTEAEWQSYQQYSDDHFRYRMVRYTFVALMEDELNRVRSELNAVRAAGAEAPVEFVEVGLDGRKIPHTTDAKVWASEFVKTITANPSIASDVDTMLGWFANAMCAQMDESDRRHAAKSTPGVDALVSEVERMKGVASEIAKKYATSDELSTYSGGHYVGMVKAYQNVLTEIGKLRAVKHEADQEQIGGATS